MMHRQRVGYYFWLSDLVSQVFAQSSVVPANHPDIPMYQKQLFLVTQPPSDAIFFPMSLAIAAALKV